MPQRVGHCVAFALERRISVAVRDALVIAVQQRDALGLDNGNRDCERLRSHECERLCVWRSVHLGLGHVVQVAQRLPQRGVDAIDVVEPVRVAEPELERARHAVRDAQLDSEPQLLSHHAPHDEQQRDRVRLAVALAHQQRQLSRLGLSDVLAVWERPRLRDGFRLCDAHGLAFVIAVCVRAVH